MRPLFGFCERTEVSHVEAQLLGSVAIARAAHEELELPHLL
jgi:hypothetical protein